MFPNGYSSDWECRKFVPLDIKYPPSQVKKCIFIKQSKPEKETLPFSQLNDNWMVWKGDWMAHVCHSVTFQLRFSYISVYFMEQIHPVLTLTSKY